jgi:hypothetical protein
VAKIGTIDLGEFPLLLAPMEDVSDPPFRAVCKEGGADLMYTEFISSEGLIRDAAKSRQKLDIFEYERPIGIQLFGGDIGNMVHSAQIATEVNQLRLPREGCCLPRSRCCAFARHPQDGANDSRNSESNSFARHSENTLGLG